MPKFAISTETSGDRVRVIIREATTRNVVFAFWGTEDNARQLEKAAREISDCAWSQRRREQTSPAPGAVRLPAWCHG